MTTVDLNRDSVNLADIILRMTPGEQVSIVKEGELVGMLTRAAAGRWPCQAGSAKHLKHWMAPDFDAPLDDFREYME